MADRWFVGVDLAWSGRHPSGLAVLRGDEREVRFESAEVLTSLDEIAERVRALRGTCFVAIDAPLAVPNDTGMRPVDREITRRYGRYQAGAHPANRRLLRGCVRGDALVRRLREDGFRIAADPEADARADARRAFETYPHAGMVELFRLERTFKYKRGRVAARRAGLRRLAARFAREFPIQTPPLPVTGALADLLTRDPEDLRGRALKSHEDVLDALFCAYLAAFYWAWGFAQSRVLGDPRTGAVILPNLIGA